MSLFIPVNAFHALYCTGGGGYIYKVMHVKLISKRSLLIAIHVKRVPFRSMKPEKLFLAFLFYKKRI